MAQIRRPRPWELPAARVTPEADYLDRRAFLRRLGLGVTGLAGLAGTSGLGAAGLLGCGADGGASAQERGPLDNVPVTPTADLYPEARRDPRFTPGARHGDVSDASVVASYNNFYEFGTEKEGVWRRVDRFQARPWRVEIAGLVEEPASVELTELERAFPLEERIYRLRCVEAWSVVVPWIGFPLRSLLERFRPTAAARYVRFVSFLRPQEAVGQRTQTWYPWPYYEALRLDEAMNELAFVATGMYGRPLQKQNGAPIRLVAPWKYGYKSIKSIERIELTASRPPTFWNDVVPAEYGFFSNVDPEVPHPRWSQATEVIVGTDRRVPTLPYNGYGSWVAGLYG